MSQWDERYATFGASYGVEPNTFLVEAAAHLPPGSRVLSLGEGEGRNAMYLARQGHFVTAVDASSRGLENAVCWAAREGLVLHTVHADLNAFDPGVESWDAIVSIWVHLPPTTRKEVFRRSARALRPGGLVIIEAYRPEQLAYRTGGPPERELLVSLADLRAALEGLEFLRAAETLREVHEGRLHTGLSAVVQVIARKPAREVGRTS